LHPVTWILRAFAAFFLLLLVSSSLSLFTRASNLTNRGIVDWGPYRIIRHPGYFAKNMFWLMTLIPAFVPNKVDPRFTWPAYLLFCATLVWGFLGWGTLYFLRSITEERFLMRDPDYVAYCKKVRYRFIPGVY
jgi:protein-S-isoprenylcysteine O-methyltransferase Ste14